MPGNAYAVILTELGKSHVEGALGFLPEMSQFTDSAVMEASFAAAKIRLQNLINQQKKLEAQMRANGIDFKKIQNSYAKTDSITVDELIAKLNPKIEKANSAKEKYSIYAKELTNVVDAYKKAINNATRQIARLKMENPDNPNFIANLKSYISELESCQNEISKTEMLYYKTISEIDEYSQQAILYNEDLNSLVAQYASGGAYKIELVNDKKADNAYGKRVKVSSIKDKGGQTKVAQAISRYLNTILKRSKGDIEKLRKQKYTGTTQGKNKNSVANQLGQAIQQIRTVAEAAVANKDILSKHNLGRETMTDAINQLANALEQGKREVTIVASLGGSDAAKIGELTEKYHAFLPSHQQIVEDNITKEDYMQVVNTGKLTRQVTVAVPFKEVKYASYRMSMNKIHNKMPNLEDLDLSEEMDSTMRSLKDFSQSPEYDKVDNLIKTRGENGQDYYIAISDKFYQAHFLQNIPVLGSRNMTNLEITPTNLASSFDMISGMTDDITNNLIFTMLNMSTASILRNEETASKLEELLQNIAATYFFEFAFNPTNFIKNIEKEFPELSNPTMSENTLYVFNLGPMFVSVSEVLEGLLNQFNNKNLIEDVVKVVAKYDTAHYSLPLWYASLRAEPINKSARWNWVANQIAANTKLSIAFNIQALLTALS